MPALGRVPTYTLKTAAGTPDLVQAVAETLRVGGVAILPTETVYGLACRHDDAAARDRIYRIKGRPDGKPLQVLVAGLDALQGLGVAADRRFERLAARFWPGALTIVVPTAAGDTVGVRWPDHPFVAAVIAATGVPLAATSANPTGVEPAASAALGFTDLAQQPDLIVTGHCGGGAASSVVRLAPDGSLEVLRQGAIPGADLHAALAEA